MPVEEERHDLVGLFGVVDGKLNLHTVHGSLPAPASGQAEPTVAVREQELFGDETQHPAGLPEAPR